MSSKPSFQLLDALKIPNEEDYSETLQLIAEELSEDMPETSEDFKVNLPQMSQEKLCEIIVCFRYLGFMQEESILAMEELARRRGAGEVFNFEAKIEELTKDLPSINIDINKMMKSFRMLK